jgi:hypothetical protein
MTLSELFRPKPMRRQFRTLPDMLEKDAPTPQEKPSPLLKLFREVEQEHDDHIQYLANRRFG